MTTIAVLALLLCYILTPNQPACVGVRRPDAGSALHGISEDREHLGRV